MGGEIASLVRPVHPPCVLPERKNIAAGGGLKKIRVFDSFFSSTGNAEQQFYPDCLVPTEKGTK